MSKNKDVSIRVLGNKGQELNANMFKQELKKSDLNDPNLIEIFNKYNQNGDDKLDENEMQSLFSDIQTSAQNIDTSKNLKSLKRADIKGSDCGRIFDEIDSASGKKDSVLTSSQIKDFYTRVQNKNKTLEPAEIQKLIKSKGLSKKIKVGDVLNFLDKLEVNAHVKNLGDFTLNDKTKKEFASIANQNIADVLTAYKKANGESIIQHIANRRWALGDKRNNYINIIKYKLLAQAELYGVDAGDFSQKFDKELKDMDLTLMFTEKTSKLDALVDDLVGKIQKKEKTYKENRNGIASIMSNPEDCRTDDDKYDLINRIIKIGNQNNPKKILSDIIKNTKDKKVKKKAQALLNSKIISDYFPTFVASIIAQESQFRGTDDAVFTPNGQGMMQLTKVGVNNIFHNPANYDKDFIKRIKKNHQNTDTLFNAIQNNRDADLNMAVGSGLLSGYVKTILQQISNDSTSIPKGINTDEPEVLMQLVARAYNGNGADKKDKKHDDKISTVRDIYGRDVIQRFQRSVPKEAQVTRYFEYNPDTKKFVNRRFSS